MIVTNVEGLRDPYVLVVDWTGSGRERHNRCMYVLRMP